MATHLTLRKAEFQINLATGHSHPCWTWNLTLNDLRDEVATRKQWPSVFSVYSRVFSNRIRGPQSKAVGVVLRRPQYSVESEMWPSKCVLGGWQPRNKHPKHHNGSGQFVSRLSRILQRRGNSPLQVFPLSSAGAAKTSQSAEGRFL